MIDQTRAIVAAAVVAAVALLAIGVGFAAGRATSDSNTDETASETPDHDRDGAGLPAGPHRVEDGIPMGFAPTEDGALAAAATWLPLLSVAPEQPEGIEAVLLPEAEPPIAGDVTVRFALVPLAAEVTEVSDTEEVRVDLLTMLVGADPQTVDIELREAPVVLEWDDGADDWRIASVDTTGDTLEPPIRPEDLDGYEVLHATGGFLGQLLAETVPGE